VRSLWLLAVILCACEASAPNGGGLPLGFDAGADVAQTDDGTADAAAGQDDAYGDPGCATSCRCCGKCWKVNGLCTVVSDADCSQSEGCAWGGPLLCWTSVYFPGQCVNIDRRD